MKTTQKKYTRDEIINMTAKLAAQRYAQGALSNYTQLDLDKQQLTEIKNVIGSFDIQSSIAKVGCEQTALNLDNLVKSKGYTLGIDKIKSLLSSVYGCSFGQKTVVIGTGVTPQPVAEVPKSLAGSGTVTAVSSVPETQEMRVLAYVKQYGCPKSLLDVRNYVNRVRFANPLTDDEIKNILAPLGCKLVTLPQPIKFLPTNTVSTNPIPPSTTSTTPSIGEVSLPPLGSPKSVASTSTTSTSSRPAPSYRSFGTASGSSSHVAPSYRSFGTASGSSGTKTAVTTDAGMNTNVMPQANQVPTKKAVPWVGIGVGALTIALLVGLYMMNKKKLKKS